MIKNWLKKVTGVVEIEAAAKAAELRRVEEEAIIAQLKIEKDAALADTQKAVQDAELSRMSEKTCKTRRCIK